MALYSLDEILGDLEGVCPPKPPAGSRRRLLPGEREMVPEEVLAAWRQEAEEDCATLESASPEVRFDYVNTARSRFMNPFLVERLVDKSKSFRFDAPHEARHWAELAVAVALNCPPERFGPQRGDRALARAWAYLGNALRLSGETVGASARLVWALWLARKSCPQDLEIQAEILDLWVSLLACLGRLERSLRWAERLIACHRQAGHSHLAGRLLVSKAVILLRFDRFEDALAAVESARPLLDPAVEPMAEVCCVQVGGIALAELGRLPEAAAATQEMRTLLAGIPDRKPRLHLRWLEGVILNARGDLAGAQRTLVETRHGFLQMGFGTEAALVALYLAETTLKQGLGHETLTAAFGQDFPSILKATDIHEEAVRALLAFHDAVVRGLATATLARAVARYMELSRYNPGLRFEAPS